MKNSQEMRNYNSFKHLLQNFDFNESFLNCDVNMALKSLKELYDDMIWRFCRVADNQFRKDMINVFRNQKNGHSEKASCGIISFKCFKRQYNQTYNDVHKQ